MAHIARWEQDRLLHTGYDDVYFNPAGGLAESAHVFLGGNRLPQRFSALAPGAVFTIGEAGFGTGRNFLATWDSFRQHAPAGARLVYHAFEAQPLPFPTAARAVAAFAPLRARMGALAPSWPLSIPGCAPVWTGDPGVTLRVWVGDILDGLAEADFRADAWFLDGFMPSQNPEMWSRAVLSAVARRTRPGGTLATYTAAGHVRRGLQEVGFAPQRVPGFNGKLHMLTATRTDAPAPSAPETKPPRYPPAPLRPVQRAVVIGAGIAGSSAARALAEDGAEVVVVEAEGVASGASGNPLGLVQPLPNLGGNPVGDWYSRAFVWTRALAARLGLPWDPAGVTRHAPSDKRRARIDRLLTELGWDGVLAPAADPSAAMDIHHAAIVEPVTWCRRLLQHPRITTHAPERVTGLRPDGGRWSVETDRGLRGGFDAVVLANSAAARALTGGLPLRWVRGQLGWVASTEASRSQQRALCHDGYLLPARDGAHLLGATYHPDDTTLSWREADWATLLGKVRANLPAVWAALEGAPERLGGRVALRGVTPGRLPFVGPAIRPDAISAAWREHGGGSRPWFGPEGLRAGVWCTVGHGSRGLSSGPFAAAVLSAMMRGAPMPLPARLAEAVHPSRAHIAAEKRTPRP